MPPQYAEEIEEWLPYCIRRNKSGIETAELRYPKSPLPSARSGITNKCGWPSIDGESQFVGD
jgi:hypothetical protein